MYKDRSSKHFPRVQRIAFLSLLQSQSRLLHLTVRLHILALGTPSRLLQPDLATDLVGADILLVLVDDGSTEAALEDDDRRQDEAGADLHERDVRQIIPLDDWLLLVILALSGFLAALLRLADLVDPDPDLAIHAEDADDAVDERLHPLDAFLRHAEDLAQHLPDEGPILGALLAYVGTLLVKGAVEDDQAPPTFQAVPRKARPHLAHRVDVRHVELDRGPVGRQREPEVEVLAALARLEEEHDIARMQLREVVEKQVVAAVLFRVEFALLVRVWEERHQIGEEMSVSKITSLANNLK